MTEPVVLTPPDMSAAAAWDWANEQHVDVCLVGTDDHLLGTATRQQLDEWRQNTADGQRIGDLVSDQFVHTHPDHSIDIVLERLAESGGVLPVVSRAEVHRLVGIVTPDTVLPIRQRQFGTSRTANNR